MCVCVCVSFCYAERCVCVCAWLYDFLSNLRQKRRQAAEGRRSSSELKERAKKEGVYQNDFDERRGKS